MEAVLKCDIRLLREIFKKYGDEEVCNAVDIYNRGVIHIICKVGSVSSLEYMLSKGLPTDSRDRWLRTPSHIAALGGNTRCLEILLKSDPNCFNQIDIYN